MFVCVWAQYLNTKTVFRFLKTALKVDEKVAAVAASSVALNSPFSCRLKGHCTIYTAELPAILFAVKQAYESQESK